MKYRELFEAVTDPKELEKLSLEGIVNDMDLHSVVVFDMETRFTYAVLYTADDSMLKDIWFMACDYMDDLDNNVSGAFALTLDGRYALKYLSTDSSLKFIDLDKEENR